MANAKNYCTRLRLFCSLQGTCPIVPYPCTSETSPELVTSRTMTRLHFPQTRL
jgi:hypothetical protein